MCYNTYRILWLSYYKASQFYVDTIEASNNIKDGQGRNIGKDIWYKRTYKNGKVTYFHR